MSFHGDGYPIGHIRINELVIDFKTRLDSWLVVGGDDTVYCENYWNHWGREGVKKEGRENSKEKREERCRNEGGRGGREGKEEKKKKHELVRKPETKGELRKIPKKN